MTWRVIVGTLSVVGTLVLMGLVAVTEPDRMASFERAYAAREIEDGGAIFASRCELCHGPNGQGRPGKGPALNDVALFDGTRGKDIGWAGSVDNFIRTTIAGGRPRASVKYQEFIERMPTWGEEYGGSLRTDQVDALVAFIMNWQWNYKDPVTGKFTSSGTPAVVDPIGTDITVKLLEGNAANGQKLAEAKGCFACHVTAPTGPAWRAEGDPNGEGIGTRAEKRLGAGYTGKADSAAQYLLEAIIQPNAYLVPGESYVVAATGKSLMPETYPATLEKQDVADLIAYLLSLK